MVKERKGTLPKMMTCQKILIFVPTIIKPFMLRFLFQKCCLGTMYFQNLSMNYTLLYKYLKDSFVVVNISSNIFRKML